MLGSWKTTLNKGNITAISGKCLVVISDYRSSDPIIKVFVQSASGWPFAKESVSECVKTDTRLYLSDILSKRQKALPNGTTIRLAIRCLISHHRTSEYEWEPEMEILSIRTLREQLPNAKLRRKWKLYAK